MAYRISERDLNLIADHINKSDGNYAVVIDTGEVIFNKDIRPDKMAKLGKIMIELMQAYFGMNAQGN